jgi:hypothetical protein
MFGPNVQTTQRVNRDWRADGLDSEDPNDNLASLIGSMGALESPLNQAKEAGCKTSKSVGTSRDRWGQSDVKSNTGGCTATGKIALEQADDVGEGGHLTCTHFCACGCVRVCMRERVRCACVCDVRCAFAHDSAHARGRVSGCASGL